jgi:hypothetical protein
MWNDSKFVRVHVELVDTPGQVDLLFGETLIAMLEKCWKQYNLKLLCVDNICQNKKVSFKVKFEVPELKVLSWQLKFAQVPELSPSPMGKVEKSIGSVPSWLFCNSHE